MCNNLYMDACNLNCAREVLILLQNLDHLGHKLGIFLIYTMCLGYNCHIFQLTTFVNRICH